MYVFSSLRKQSDRVCVCVCVSRFADTLEIADDMAIDIPHIWLYLAELLSPLLRDGGFSMREFLR